ncbi:MAG: SDR family oxidoreductase [Bacteroidota bacterium]|nr:SDR family oxidoreductase [Bacteroidota bacterium]
MREANHLSQTESETKGKVLLFGATGNLGKAIAKELVSQHYDLTVVVRNQQKAKDLSAITSKYVVANIADANSLIGICNGFDIVVSALGKSVSPNDKSKPSFRDIDLNANSAVLNEALKSGVKKFVYVSAYESEKHLDLEYFKVHHEFSEKLKQSGINYSIIKPPAIFCAFIDMIKMAQNGKLVTIGSGDKKTNPIYEGDLAKVCVDAISITNTTIEAGGKNIYTRKQLNEIIQQRVDASKKIRTIPLGLMKFALLLFKLFDRNSYDKFAFFTAVYQHDTIAPQIGGMKFEDYIDNKVKNIR